MTNNLAIIGPIFMKIKRIRLDFTDLFDYAVTIFGGVQDGIRTYR
jgi:hypothetical protein